jgi:hypothetical protein
MADATPSKSTPIGRLVASGTAMRPWSLNVAVLSQALLNIIESQVEDMRICSSLGRRRIGYEGLWGQHFRRKSSGWLGHDTRILYQENFNPGTRCFFYASPQSGEDVTLT